MTEMVPASQVINRVCEQMGYSRSHVANMVRRHYKALGAERRGGRWYLPEKRARILVDLVRTTSGPRYKLGERK